MNHSYTSKSNTKKNGLATGYTSLLGLMVPFKVPENTALTQLLASSEDMAHYLVAHLNNGTYGNNSVISGSGMEQTHTVLMPGVSPYGMGWYVGNDTIHSVGTKINFRANICLSLGDNQEKWGVVVLINSSEIISFYLTGRAPYGDISRDLLHLVHGKQPVNDYAPFKMRLLLSSLRKNNR